MIEVPEAFPNREILAALSRELGWSHFVEIVSLDDPLKREFSAEKAGSERSFRNFRR
jgi:hypothetical protein